MKVLQVNNIDLVGKRFNGYDISEKYKNDKNINSKEYEEADIISFHMHHNSKYSLNLLNIISKNKKVIINIHDQWFITGNGIIIDGKQDLSNLNNIGTPIDNVFSLSKRNAKELWNIKESILRNQNIEFIISSEYMLEKFNERKIVSKDRIHFVPFGIDLKKFKDNGEKPKLRKKYKISLKDTVIFFRSQKEFKGTDYIVKALKKYDTKKNITIITCGEVGLLNDIENKYKVLEFGFVEGDQIIDLYLMSDFFLMPSLGESFGFMAVESMACSRPVIVFDNSSLPTVADAPNSGYLVKNKDYKGLLLAIDHFINNPDEVRERGNKSRKFAETHYDVNNYYSSLEEAYFDVYQKKRKVKEVKSNIDLSSANKIIRKLEKVSRSLSLSDNQEMKSFFEKYYYKRKTFNFPIKYSNAGVQKKFFEFNMSLYQALNKNNDSVVYEIRENVISIVFRKTKTVFRLIKNNRDQLIPVIKEKIENMRGKNE